MTRKMLVYAQTALLLCTGCGRAPSVDIVGSFFPVWMVCVTVAIIFTCLLRLLLVRYHFEAEIGPVALFYPSLVILLSCSLWLLFFR